MPNPRQQDEAWEDDPDRFNPENLHNRIAESDPDAYGPWPGPRPPKGPLAVEVTLRFSLRPAGWIANDHYVVQRVVGALFNALNFLLVGDEHFSTKIRWKRSHEHVWRIVPND